MISTRQLEQLGQIEDLKKLLQSLSVLDLIMSPEWAYRYYSFNAKWDTSEQMGSMRNGQGDSFIAWFTENGCFFKGFDHESEMSSWAKENQKPIPSIYEKVPDILKPALIEPAFSIEDVSFCFWRLQGDQSWSIGDIHFPETDDPDGSEFLLEILNGNPQKYQSFVEEYYEEIIPLESIRHIYAHKPLDIDIIKSLNAEVSLDSIQEELVEIGYPQK